MQAIIFLAPLTFNLTLEEDPSVNRIEDSIIIWKAICSNKLLERTAIILFLNKMDVLAATLGSGLRVKDYVPSYGDLPNDVPSVSRCMSLSPRVNQFTNFLWCRLQGEIQSISCAYDRPQKRFCSFDGHRKSCRPGLEHSFGMRHRSLYVGWTPPFSLLTFTFVIGHRRDGCDTFRGSRGHPSLPTCKIRRDLDVIVRFVGFLFRRAQRSGCSATSFRNLLHVNFSSMHVSHAHRVSISCILVQTQ